MTTPDRPPQFVGFGDGNASGNGSEGMRQLLRAARAAILPAPASPPPVDATETPYDRIAGIADDIAKIANALRHDSGFDRLTAAAALDRLRKRLDMIGIGEAANH